MLANLTCTLHINMNAHSVFDMGCLTYLKSFRACKATLGKVQDRRGALPGPAHAEFMRTQLRLWRGLGTHKLPKDLKQCLSILSRSRFHASAYILVGSSAEGPPKQKLSALPFRVRLSTRDYEGANAVNTQWAVPKHRRACLFRSYWHHRCPRWKPQPPLIDTRGAISSSHSHLQVQCPSQDCLQSSSFCLTVWTTICMPLQPFAGLQKVKESFLPFWAVAAKVDVHLRGASLGF